ncbi:amine oxidase catalytic domain-containing protein [Crucibulum laeve]|uniref:Amine oxidase n=1 Tax=Crucibulum laeve TaxID=68775 RepID=A0A5C3LIJ2_9AGAR|nr:amine oxidase catalytic domain-containing protein [Crucibulum laeve]
MSGGYERLKDYAEDVELDTGPKENTSSKQRYFGLGCIVLTAVVLLSILLTGTPDFNTILSGGIFSGDALSAVLQSPIVGPNELKQCPSGLPPLASPPAPVNLWASLTVPETTAIHAWLESSEQNLNLTRADISMISDNVVFMIEAYQPPKAEALAYLSSPKTVPRPDRYARVTIHHGAAQVPFIKDYLVGPMPVSSKTTMRPLTEIYHRDEIPFNAYGFASISELQHFLAQLVEPLGDAMEELFGASARGLPNDTLIAGSSAPFSFDGSFRRMWVTWRHNKPGPYLLPVGFYQYVDISGTDASQWKILKVVYNHQSFPSTASFLDAFHNGTLARLPRRPDQKDSTWTQRKRVGKPRDLDHLPGPRSVSFAGLRFRVDKARQYVSWMGWGMYLAFDRDMGLSLWDVRLKGERVIYQLAPQEAIAQYSGNDPLQTTTAWLDRFFGMGGLVRDMIPGYDCPLEAVYLPATTYSSAGSIKRERAICIFEQDTGKPISRHYGYMEGEFGAVKGYTLTVRSISTVGNYDYLFDYTFHLDGTMEVRVSASGYLQGGFWEDDQKPYGASIRDTTMGNLHDHIINFKVDLDIAGTSNSLLHTTTEQEEVTQPWFDDDWGQTVIQQRIDRNYITNENDALVKYPTNFQGGYAFVNQAEKNAWGNPRGYTIHPGYSPVHNTVVGSKRLFNNANWARYNLAVSRRKDTEPASSSMWNLHLPGAPMVDFHKFFDGENITQEDLVAWVNLGMHHLPQAEDSPNTKTNVATSSFMLSPLNYFDSDISLESMNAIFLHSPEKPGDPYTYDDNGVKQDFTCIPGATPPFVYSNVKTFNLDGEEEAPFSVEKNRERAEMSLRVKAVL